MPARSTLRERFNYAFDKTLSRGPAALISWLGLATLILIAVAIAVIMLGSGAPQGASFVDVFWQVVYQALTPNPVDPTAFPPLFMIVTFGVTIGSLFLVSILIGILSNEIQGRVEAMRRGRSKVLEDNHSVILGWSPQIFTIISELASANENRKAGAAIAILADQDKVAMEDEIRGRLPHTGNTRVICRSGSPIDPTDIELVSPHTARSVIILPQGNDPDSYVIKCVLALTNNPKRRPEPYHVVTQVRSPETLDVLRMIGQKDLVQPVLTNDLIARVVAQTSRQSGLSVVYTELMNFSGDEIYFAPLPAALVGKTYGDALFAYEDSAVIGVQHADGAVLMNPSMETSLVAGDRLFAISADDDTVRPSGLSVYPVEEGLIQPGRKPRRPAPEKCLILGWNRSGATIICELDNYVPKGSQTTVFSDSFNLNKQIREACGRLANQKIEVLDGETTDRASLDKLKIADYDHVIVLAYSGLEPQEADAKTLITLLHLRDIAERDETPFSIVSEMLDLRNRELAEVAGVNDFIVSEHLVSLMMSQLSENADLFAVFTDIFDPEGSEIYLKDIDDYIKPGKPVNFYTLVEAARRRGETAIGYRLLSEASESGSSYGVHTNPKKSAMVTFSSQDKIIVLAES